MAIHGAMASPVSLGPPSSSVAVGRRVLRIAGLGGAAGQLGRRFQRSACQMVPRALARCRPF